MLKHRFRCLFTGDEGFTLIETLITVALIGLIIAAGFGIYSVGVRLYNAGQNQTTIQFELRRIAEFISDEVRLASHVELLSEVPIPEDGVTDIYFRDNNIYIRRPYNDPIVLSTQDKGQLTGLSFSSEDSKLLDFELDAILGKQEYDIKSAVLPLNLQGDIKVGDDSNSSFIAVRLGQVGGGFDGVLFASGYISNYYCNIHGNVYTNGTVHIEGPGDNHKGMVIGDLILLGRTTISNDDITFPDWSTKDRIITGEIKPELAKRSFNVPDVVEIPNFLASERHYEKFVGTQISKSGWYKHVWVNGQLDINVGDEDIELYIERLDIKNDFNVLDNLGININSSGNGIIKLYVKEINMEGGTKMNAGGNPEKLEIYYSGTQTPVFGNDIKISGKIDLGHMEFRVNGGSPVTGSVITRSTGKITISDAGKFTGLLYAPKAEVTLTGGSYLEGQLICYSFEINGDAEMKYNNAVIPQGIKLN